MEVTKDKSEIIERYRNGVLCRDFSGRLTYEIHESMASEYKQLRKLIRKKFRLFPIHPALNTPDEILQDHIGGLKRVGIEWDCWSGFIVVAKSKKAELLVYEIGKFLESEYKHA